MGQYLGEKDIGGNKVRLKTSTIKKQKKTDKAALSIGEGCFIVHVPSR